MNRYFVLVRHTPSFAIVSLVCALFSTAVTRGAIGEETRDIRFAAKSEPSSTGRATSEPTPPAQAPRGTLRDLATFYPETASREAVDAAFSQGDKPVLQIGNHQEAAPPPASQVIEPRPAPSAEISAACQCPNCYPRPYCDTLGPCSPCSVRGFHCVGGPCCQDGTHGRHTWEGAGPIPWQVFAHGEYVGPARLAHVPEYHLRVDDRLDFVFRLTRMASDEAYQLEVGDELRIRSLTAPEVETDALVQPDGRIALPRLGPIAASGLTLVELQQSLNDAFQGAGIRDPQITVTPVQINTRLEELRATVDNRYGTGGQSRLVRVTPEGTIQLPAIGTVFVQGYTLPELKREIDLRYQEIVSGLEVTPILDERAPRFCYVVGEVRIPGRFELVAPTTIIQAISLAGGWNVGAKLEHVVVFRRDENWNLMATKVNLRPALFGKSPCPAGEIWLRDSDIVIVPKSCILTTTDAIDLIFTRGVYAVFPFSASLQLDRLNTLP